MLPSVTLGRIVSADTQREAKKIFKNRRKYGISGVVFTPKLEIPEWSEDEKIVLTSLEVRRDPVTRKMAPDLEPSKEWQAAGGNFSKQFVGLSAKFNRSRAPRTVQFAMDNSISAFAHRDPSATKGWLHLHISGAGMICANPVGSKPVIVSTLGTWNERLYAVEFNELVAAGKIDMMALQADEAIIFDHNMVHQSGKGPRFRAIAVDT